MSETDISTAAVEAEAKRLRDHGHSGTHGILPVTLALLADRDRLAAEVARMTEAATLVLRNMNTQVNGGWGWMAEFERLIAAHAARQEG